MVPVKHVFIALPTYRGPGQRTENALENSTAIAAVKGWRVDIVPRMGDSCLPRARNVLFTQFLLSQATDMLFADDDMGWSADDFVRIMEHDAAMVGGAYRARGPKEFYVFRSLGEELRRESNGLIEVEGLGCGFLRITRDAAETLVTHYPDDWYHDVTVPDMKVRDMFAFSVEDHVLRSEDYNFCRKWRWTGGKVWCDPTLELDHDGNSGRLLDWLRRTATPTTPSARNAA